MGASFGSGAQHNGTVANIKELYKMWEEKITSEMS